MDRPSRGLAIHASLKTRTGVRRLLRVVRSRSQETFKIRVRVRGNWSGMGWVNRKMWANSNPKRNMIKLFAGSCHFEHNFQMQMTSQPQSTSQQRRATDRGMTCHHRPSTSRHDMHVLLTQERQTWSCCFHPIHSLTNCVLLSSWVNSMAVLPRTTKPSSANHKVLGRESSVTHEESLLAASLSDNQRDQKSKHIARSWSEWLNKKPVEIARLGLDKQVCNGRWQTLQCLTFFKLT